MFIEHIRSLNIPLVILDNNVDYQLAARVGCDSAEGIRQMVQYLWMRGHDRIGFLGGEEDSIVTQERYQAYSDALKAVSYTHLDVYKRQDGWLCATVSFPHSLPNCSALTAG